METVSPENTLTAVNQASEAIISKGRLDHNFPDLRTTFSDAATYEVTKADTVKPVLLKQSIVLHNEGLETLRQYDANVSPAGIAPFINRAYYVSKNCLYLWDYVEKRMIAHEEVDDIVGVAFVPPKAGIFNQNVNYLMIISTVRQVKIIAMEYSPAAGLRVFETGMSTTTSGVNMKTIIGTKFGRIFMLGNDGNIWELDYRQEETWFQGKCTKKLHTSGSAFSFLIATVRDPITQIAVNESGTVLYHLTESSTIAVTDLGVDGQLFETVHYFKDVLSKARGSLPSTPLLDASTFKVISINPTSPKESKEYHLVAITSTGCRLYFNHNKSNQHLKDDSPNTLLLSHVRIPAPDITPKDVFSKAYYKDGLMIAVKNPHEKPNEDKIITYSPDLAILTNPAYINSPLVEFNNAIDLPGKVIAITEVTTSSYSINEMTATYETPGRTFLVLTTYGISVLYKQRPIDMLYKLLENTNIDTAARLRDYESFFTHFGYVNSVSLCFGIICNAISSTSNDPIHSVEAISEVIIKSAISLLETFGQTPSVFDPSYTSRHDGLALFIYRIILPIWDVQIIKETAPGVYISNLSTKDLQRTQHVLRKLSLAMSTHSRLFVSSYMPEEKSFHFIKEFANYTSEAIAFIQYIIDTDLPAIVKSLKPASQSRCKTITLKELISKPDGRALASDLSYALVDYTFSKVDNTNYVIDVLTQRCKSFCGSNDVLLYKAVQQIYSARSATNTSQAKTILTDSLNMLNKIALHIPADKAAEIAQDFAYQNYHVYGIKLALACAKARDPHNTTNALVESNFQPDHPKMQIFKNKQPFYDIVFDSLNQVVTKNAEPMYRNTVFNAAFQGCQDKAFAYYVFEKFLTNGLGQELIKESPPHLEAFLKHNPISYERLGLLADYFKSQDRFEEAASAYYQLASAAPDLKTRINTLVSASVCAQCVTAPAKQYDMLHLTQMIQQNLDEARQQEAIPSQ